MDQRCSNCIVSTFRLKRVPLSDNQEALNLIRQWHPNRTINDSHHICNECFRLINQKLESGETYKPVFGHVNSCLGCGRSLCGKRGTSLSLDNVNHSMIYNVIQRWCPFETESDGQVCQVCYACRIRAHRYLSAGAREKSKVTKVKNLTEEQHPVITRSGNQGPGTILLPNYMRANTTRRERCVFLGCEDKEISKIPMELRKIILVDHSYYLPPDSRICNVHLEGGNWKKVVTSGVKLFTAEHIEDMIEVLKSDRMFG